MAYLFTVDNVTYAGRTLAGTSRMRVHYKDGGDFVAAFDPDTKTLLDDNPSGAWVDVADDTTADLLAQIEPSVIAACRKRFEWIQRINHGPKLVKG